MKLITLQEFLMDRAILAELPPELATNAKTIVPKANDLLTAFGTYRRVNSGYRRPEDNTAAGGATKSKHMICAAIDLEDSDKKLKNFCISNLDLLEKIGLWMEHPDSTPTWCHVQCIGPKSGKRVFKP